MRAKGGVGKSTTSSLSALKLAREGHNVLLVSLDPAHNQADIFDTELTGKPASMADNLRVAQADIDKWIKEYIKGVERQIKANYTYQTAFNLEKHLNVVKHSPGIEEYGLLLAFQHYRKQYPDADVILYDMPPTALTLKFFQPARPVPHLAGTSPEAPQGDHGKEGDHHQNPAGETGKSRPTRSWAGWSSNSRSSRNSATSSKTRTAARSTWWSTRTGFPLPRPNASTPPWVRMDMKLSRIIMNKMTEACTWDECSTLMHRYDVSQLPLSPTPLIGIPALNAYLDAYSDNLGL